MADLPPALGVFRGIVRIIALVLCVITIGIAAGALANAPNTSGGSSSSSSSSGYTPSISFTAITTSPQEMAVCSACLAFVFTIVSLILLILEHRRRVSTGLLVLDTVLHVLSLTLVGIGAGALLLHWMWSIDCSTLGTSYGGSNNGAGNQNVAYCSLTKLAGFAELLVAIVLDVIIVLNVAAAPRTVTVVQRAVTTVVTGS